MLMEGGYLPHITRIMEYYRISSKWCNTNRHNSSNNSSSNINVPIDANPVFILSAATVPSSGMWCVCDCV